MNAHIINTYPYTVDEHDVQSFEQKYHIRLPEPYRSFLIETNGGYPDKDRFPTPWNELNQYIIVDYFYGLNYRRDTWGDLSDARTTFTDRIPEDLVAIASDPGGNQICLGLAGERYGQIFFWEMEEESDEEPPTYDNVSFVANSFQQFLDGLYADS